MNQETTMDRTLDSLADALRQEKRVLITCHVKPDGDAIGSLIAMHRAMSGLGADSVMYLADDSPVAPEFRWLPGLSEAVFGTPPTDHASRTLISVDCGSAERIGNEDLVVTASRIINIDHHSDNTRFGKLNLVVAGASSTAEILYFVLRKMGVELTMEIAEALYTGILVDSGRFQYSSATATTFRVAADLISRGVDHTEIFHNVYETVPLAKSRLLCRLLTNMTIACDGSLAIGLLDREDFESAGAGNGLTEGLVDNLRAIEGVRVAALIYARPGGSVEPGHEDAPGKTLYRVSLRSSSEALDVQRIAGAKGGGGHRQAAGYTAEDESSQEIIDYLTASVARALEED
ncbi:MAG: bifunctional oligoribonuclease/PAP phosphatase NrnA [Actinobacteria bacterium]|nr:bifunctional oligoribonuclease/PAP phosphatase NrnA [Actinomycetota bacterium]